MIAALLSKTFAAPSSRVGVGDAETSDAASAQKTEESFMVETFCRRDHFQDGTAIQVLQRSENPFGP